MLDFFNAVVAGLKSALPMVGPFLVLSLVPFVIAERLRPVGLPPRLSDYGFNVLIAISGLVLSLPFGIAAGMLAAQVRPVLPWQAISWTFSDFAAVPVAGPVLEILAMIFVPLLVHDFWFYWSHRLEHRVPQLWAFHSLHHSDENMNSSTWARDHFLQTVWRSFVSIFTLGLFLDLDFKEAGQAALLSGMVLSFWSMFYHSAIRVRLPWLDRVLVTPQVHRIHHSINPAHHNRNFADVFPIFDILFGTFRRPEAEEFPPTGLGANHPSPRSIWKAQFAPLLWIARGVPGQIRS